MAAVVVGYGPDGQECRPDAPKCIAQSRLREGGAGPTFYARSYGPSLVDPEREVRYADAAFVRVSEAIFEKYLVYLGSRREPDFMAADRLFRQWA